MNVFNPSALAGAVLVFSASSANARDYSLESVISTHLEAVSAKDLKTLRSTLTSGEILPVYFPNGRLTRTKAEYIAFHDAWFKEAGWTMTFSKPETIVTRDLALATVATRYDDIIDGKAYWSENWLTLAFRREQGEWRLVHDQNTRIRASDTPTPLRPLE